MIEVDKIRNLAIIAHIDHGKTTLIDSIFRVTPKNIRIRKTILGAEDRKRAFRRLIAQAG